MALKSGVSGISRRPAAEPDAAGSTELSPRERLLRRAGVSVSDAAQQSAVEPREDALDTQEAQAQLDLEIAEEEETEANSVFESLAPALNAAAESMMDKQSENDEYGEEPPASNFKPEPVGRARGRPRKAETVDPSTAPKEAPMSTVELRAAIKDVELRMKELGKKKADLAAEQGDLVTEYNSLTGQLAFQLMG